MYTLGDNIIGAFSALIAPFVQHVKERMENGSPVAFIHREEIKKKLPRNMGIYCLIQHSSKNRCIVPGSMLGAGHTLWVAVKSI